MLCDNKQSRNISYLCKNLGISEFTLSETISGHIVFRIKTKEEIK